MTIEEAYTDMREWLNGRETPTEMAYSPSLGFHLRLSMPDGNTYLAVHPDETDHGTGWDLHWVEGGGPVLTGAPEGVVRAHVMVTDGARRVWRELVPA